MTFKGQTEFEHGTSGKIGVLLVNLGTPAAPTAAAVRPWLRHFLSDPRVVEVPRLLWWFILNCFILLTRPARSARAYQKIWTEQGSPLLINLQQQTQHLSERLQQRHGDRVLVKYAFSYGSPSIGESIQALSDEGMQQLLVVPLYPQYSATTGGSVFDAIAADFSSRRWLPELRMLTHYHDQPGYITALANSVQRFQQSNGTAEKLVMSFHGAPRFQLDKGDPYYCECQKTGRLLAEQLGLSETQYLVTFQSRLGAAEWLKPYTDDSLRELAEEGVKSVQVICPGFSADCLETLEEIAIQNSELFLSLGGESYCYIPCLNAETDHIDFLTDLVEENLQGWLKD
jgi:protoporphyrin/coproporphyrin ferrochelatase